MLPGGKQLLHFKHLPFVLILPGAVIQTLILVYDVPVW
jgi:hypothetical protein